MKPEKRFSSRLHRLRGRCPQLAFTLIEMLVALAVLGLIAALLFDGLKFATRAWGETREQSAARHEVWAIQRFLRGRLEGIYPFEPDRTITPVVYPLVGSADGLEFSAPLPDSASNAGFYRYSLAIKPGSGEGRDLVVRWRLDLGGQNLQVGREYHEETLLERIEDLQVEYLERNANATWTRSWRHRADIPRLVRVRVVLLPGDARVWPDFVAALRIDADANCAFDVVSQRCRAST